MVELDSALPDIKPIVVFIKNYATNTFNGGFAVEALLTGTKYSSKSSGIISKG